MNGKENRLFERYKKRLAFDLLIRGSRFKAETFDYSMAGIGAVIEDSPPIVQGDVLDVEIPNSSIRFKGQVVRTEKFSTSTRIGIARLSPIHGSLRDFKLSDIIIGLNRSGKTGILHIRSGSVHKWVYVKEGDMVFAGSNQPSDRLGDMLLQEGRITQRQYDESSQVMLKTGKRHGAVLVEMGYLSPRELPPAIKRYIERIIESIFSLRDGTFEFQEGELPSEEVITLRLSAANLIYRGIKAIKDIDSIRQELPSLDAVLTFSKNPIDLFQDIVLEDSEKRILTFVDGKTPVKDIISSIDRPKDDVLKSIYALLETRIVEVAEKEETPDIKAEEVFEKKHEASAEFIEEVERLFDECSSLDYYRILRIKDTATTQEIRRAFYKLAKEFHPDRHYHLPSDKKYKLSQVFAHISTAYSTLSNPAKRKEYDKSLTLKPEKLGSNTEIAKRRFDEGRAEFKQKRYEEAARLFGEACYLDGSVSKYHFYRGIALGRLGRYKEAERAIGRALQLEPANAEYLAEAGHIFIALGMPLRARGSFERALRIEPSNERAREGLSKIGG